MARKRTSRTKAATAVTPLPKPPAKKPPVKKPPPAQGPFGKGLYANLVKTPSAPVESAVMETIGAIPPDTLKAQLAKLSARDKVKLFNALPNSQIANAVRAQTAGILSPATPPAPAPAPPGGPPASILTTTYQNVPYPPAQKDRNWAQKITQGSTMGLSGGVEWRSVYMPFTSLTFSDYDEDPNYEREGSLDNPMVGLTGWAIQGDPPVSTADVWFTHPFGNDFQFYIAPDPQYASLCSASNNGVNPLKPNETPDAEYSEATAVAGNGGTYKDGTPRKGLELHPLMGVLGVETDYLLVPQYFQDLIVDGARVAVFGRWIVDCGHDDFHTEIHPPLLMAVATPAPPPAGRPAGASEMTQVQIMSRPYTVSQLWGDGNFAQHLLAEVAKVEDTFLGIPMSSRVEAHPKLLTPPYSGRPYVKLLVEPPPLKHGPGPLVTPHTLMVSFHFTHRSAVVTEVFDAGNGQVGLIIVFGDDNEPVPVPRKHDNTIEWQQLGSDEEWLYVGLEIADILTLQIASAFILALGILTDIYDAPSASSPLDNQNIVPPTSIDQVQPGGGSVADDGQPFPIYGWINVWWEPITVLPPRPAAGSERATGRRKTGAAKTGTAAKTRSRPRSSAAKKKTKTTAKSGAARKRTARARTSR